MRKDVKELADAMEAGWKVAPKMVVFHSWIFFQDKNGEFTHEWKNAAAACAQGHAAIAAKISPYASGAPYVGGIMDRFPILHNQSVLRGKVLVSLNSAINYLVHEQYWTTPQIIEWLRSHQND